MYTKITFFLLIFSSQLLAQSIGTKFNHLLDNKSKITNVTLSLADFIKYYNSAFNSSTTTGSTATGLTDLKKIFPKFKTLYAGERITSVVIYYYRWLNNSADSLKFSPISFKFIIEKDTSKTGKSKKGDVDSLITDTRSSSYQPPLPEDFINKSEYINDKYNSILNLLYEDKPSQFIENNEENKTEVVKIGLNEYFNSFQQINNTFALPIKKEEVKKNSGPYTGQQGSSNQQETINNPPSLYFDLSLSHFSISWNKFYQSVKNAPIGFEISADESILNALPYQNLSFTFGPRFLFALGGLDNIGNYSYVTNNTTTLDFKFMFRRKWDNRKVYFEPAFNFNSTKINVGSSILGFDFVLSKFYKYFPAIHGTIFFPSDVNEQVKNNFIHSPEYNYQTAYHSFFQAQFLMNFYKMLSNKNHRLNVNVGVGTYDIYKTNYDSTNQIIYSDQITTPIRPIIELQYNLILNNPSNTKFEPILGLTTRLFEERIKVKFWLTCLNFIKNNTDFDLRIEAFYLSSPLFRDMKQWENGGGTFFQFRLRYALSNQNF